MRIHKPLVYLCVFTGLLGILCACGAQQPQPTPTLAPLPVMQTAAVKTVVVMVRELTAAAEGTGAPPSASPTPPRKATPEPTITPAQRTPPPPGNTPLLDLEPTVQSESSAVARVDLVQDQDPGCHGSEYVDDITIPDDTVLPPGVAFTKTWRVLNSGTCDWDAGTVLYFAGGDSMGSSGSLTLSSKVPAGQTVDLSLDLIAPADAGSYVGYWMLRSPGGTSFGSGYGVDSPFWVKIIVSEDGAYPETSLPLATPATTQEGCDPSFNAGSEYDLIRLINRQRAEERLNILFRHSALTEAARQNSSAGLCGNQDNALPLADRLDAQSVRRSRAVEYEYGSMKSKDMINEAYHTWMNSPTIRKDLLGRGLTQIGVGYGSLPNGNTVVTLILTAP